MMVGGLARAGGEAIRALHRCLLPPEPRIGWTPYLWLFWLIGFFAKWFFVPFEPIEFTLALLTLPLFLALYFNGFWHSGPRVFVNIAGILLIALVWTPFNANAMTFFIYGASLIGRATRPPRAYAWLAGVVLLVAVEWLVFDLPGFVLLFGGWRREHPLGRARSAGRRPEGLAGRGAPACGRRGARADRSRPA